MCKGWIANADLIWHIKLDIHAKHFLSQLNHSWKNSCSANNHNATWQLEEMPSIQIAFDLLKNVLDTSRNNFSQILFSYFNRLNLSNHFYLERLCPSFRNISRSIVKLETFSQLLRSLQNLGDVLGYVVAAFLVYIRILKLLTFNRSHCSLTATHINNSCTKLTFPFVQD